MCCINHYELWKNAIETSTDFRGCLFSIWSKEDKVKMLYVLKQVYNK